MVFMVFTCFSLHGVYAQTVTPWLTRGDQSALLSQQSTVSFSNQGGSSPNTITINESSNLQSLSGFGFALTQGSAEVISSLNNSTRNNLLNELFDPNNGNAISIVRISIGASDLSNSVYSYNETAGDVNMNNFSLAGPDQTYLIPVLKDILAINPSIKVLATPWTAPTWMKTNNTWIGGSLSTNYYAAYATYFVRYLEEMEAEGIDIWAITPQNEPENPFNEPSMLMNSTEQRNFINNNLGPAIRGAGYDTKIIAFDHNCDNTAYPIDVLNNSSFVDGAAFHLYAGDISAMSTVQNSTGKNVYFTEQFTSSNGNFDGDFGWHMENIVVGSLRNWSKAVIEWNLASDASFGPKTPGGCTECLGAVTVNSSNSITRNVSYYIIAQVSRYIEPGAVRMSTNSVNGMSNVAFRNTDGSKVLLVYNSQNQNSSIRVQTGSSSFNYTVPGRSAITFKWSGSSTSPPIPSNIDAFQRIEAENFDSSSGVQLESTSDTGGGQNVGFIDEGDYLRFNNVDFGNGAQSVETRIASNASFTGQIEFRLNGVNGNLIGTANVGNTGGWQNWITRTSEVSNVSGIQDLYLVFKGGNGIGNVNWIQFSEGAEAPQAPSNLTAVATSTSTINLNWLDNSGNENSFRLQRSANGVNGWATIANLSSNTTSYSNNGLDEGTTYFYRVRSQNNAGNSNWSPVANATTEITPPVGNEIISGAIYQILNSGSGKAMDVSGVSFENGAGIQQWTPGSGDNQKWLVEIIEKDEYRITAVHSNRVLDVVDGSSNNNARIQQWEFFGSNNQRWRIESTNNGNYKIVSVNSNKVLDILGNGNNNGNAVVQQTSSNDPYQRWSFNLVPNAREEVGFDDDVDDQLVIYPNPGKEFITLEGGSIKSFQLLDQSGRQLLFVEKTEKQQKIDISKLKNGIYLIRAIEIDGNTFSRSFIKQ